MTTKSKSLTLQQLRAQREMILRVIERNNGAHPRVFGSVARNQQKPTSDVDMLIDSKPGMSMMDVVHIENSLASIFGVKFDVNLARGLPRRWREQALSEAVEL